MMEAGFLILLGWSNRCSNEATVASKNHTRRACGGVGGACLLGWSNGCFNEPCDGWQRWFSGQGLLRWSNARFIEAIRIGAMPSARAAGLRLEPASGLHPHSGPASLSRRQHTCASAPVPQAGPAQAPGLKAIQALRAGPTRRCRAGLCGPWFSPCLHRVRFLEPGRLLTFSPLHQSRQDDEAVLSCLLHGSALRAPGQKLGQ